MNPNRTAPLLVTVLLLAAPAVADPGDRTPAEKEIVKVKAARADRTSAPTRRVAAPAPAANLGAERFRARVKGRLGLLTNRAIHTLRRLIEATGDSDPQKPDYLFRLAEHYREKQVQHMFQARALDEPIFKARGAKERDPLLARQRRHERAERAWMVTALKEYLLIATRAPFASYKRMDVVLYNTADLLNRAGRSKKARLFFGRLIRNHPSSKYLADAYLSFAEHYFNNKQVPEALKLYQQVTRHRTSPLYGYAMYKQGWCWLNLKDPRRALEMFVKVIRHAPAGKGAGRILLVREARKDAVRAYSHVGRPEKAWAFFQRLGGARHASGMLRQLARLYQDQGKFLRSIAVHHRLMALFPRSGDLCVWQYQVLRATLPGKVKKAQAAEALRLAAIYRAFRARRGLARGVLAKCSADTAGVLRELATTWHREAQATRQLATYDLASGLYKAYLGTFPRAADRQTMAYYRAELLYAVKRWRPAAMAYKQVIEISPRSDLARDAAHAAVISWRNFHNGEEASRRARQATEHAGKVPFSADQRLMKAAFQRYLRLVPAGKERVAVLYRLGRMHYVHNHHDQAVRLFSRIVRKHSRHSLAEYAANLLLDSLNIQKKHRALKRWVDRLLDDRHLAKGSLRKTLVGLRVQLAWRRCEDLRRAGKFRRCARGYVDLANRYPDDPRWPQVMYNAAQCYEAAKLIGPAISVRMTLIGQKPDHALAKKALYQVGANYHALAWYSRAANYYERFARRFPGEPEAPAALQNAIIFRLGRQELTEAEADARLFARSYGTRRRFAARAAAVHFSLGVIHEQRGDAAAVTRHYRRYLTRWGRHGGVDRRVQAHVKIGLAQWRAACPITPHHGACVRVSRQRSRPRVVLAGGRRGSRARLKLRTQCGPATKTNITIIRRSPAQARAAQKHFRLALALLARARTAPRGATVEERRRRGRALAHAAATARFHQAEALLERFLGVVFPRGLDFSSRGKKRSERVFLRYLKRKQAGLTAARKAYQDVVKMRDAHWAIAASARVGQLFQSFADALYTAPLPRPDIPRSLVRRQDRLAFVETFNDVYCRRLEEVAYPLEVKAEQGLTTCLRSSTQLSWYSSWSRLCEAELNQIKPRAHPLAAEIRTRPVWVALRAEKVGLVSAVR